LFQFLNDPSSKTNMAYIGGVILIAFGLYHLIIKARRAKMVSFHSEAEKKPLKYILKGFILNGVTPMVFIFWIGTISIATIDFGYNTGFEFFIFFLALLVTVLATDITKAFLADKLREAARTPFTCKYPIAHVSFRDPILIERVAARAGGPPAPDVTAAAAPFRA